MIRKKYFLSSEPSHGSQEGVMTGSTKLATFKMACLLLYLLARGWKLACCLYRLSELDFSPWLQFSVNENVKLIFSPWKGTSEYFCVYLHV